MYELIIKKYKFIIGGDADERCASFDGDGRWYRASASRPPPPRADRRLDAETMPAGP